MISEGGGVFAGHVDPSTAWNALEQDPGAQLVDVRTQAEWSFVGVPDLSGLGKQTWLIEWKSFPSMASNPTFVEDLSQRMTSTPTSTIYFICRSGARSLDAAQTAAAAFAGRDEALRLYNVAEGFEGDLDGDRRRGRVNGWKTHGLPWTQS